MFLHGVKKKHQTESARSETAVAVIHSTKAAKVSQARQRYSRYAIGILRRYKWPEAADCLQSRDANGDNYKVVDRTGKVLGTISYDEMLDVVGFADWS
jgi:hypothetical protein